MPLPKRLKGSSKCHIGTVASKTLYHKPFQHKLALDQLPLEAMQAIEPRITADALAVLSVRSSVESRTSFGGTAPKNVREQAESWLKRLQNDAIPG